MIAGFTIYEACYLFLLYAFIGWGVEVVYQAVSRTSLWKMRRPSGRS